MNSTTQIAAGRSVRGLPAILGSALIGCALLFTAGLSHSETLHAAAHDVRHATGFPCH